MLWRDVEIAVRFEGQGLLTSLFEAAVRTALSVERVVLVEDLVNSYECRLQVPRRDELGGFEEFELEKLCVSCEAAAKA